MGGRGARRQNYERWIHLPDPVLMVGYFLISHLRQPLGAEALDFAHLTLRSLTLENIPRIV
jgi:hypothetical protein